MFVCYEHYMNTASHSCAAPYIAAQHIMQMVPTKKNQIDHSYLILPFAKTELILPQYLYYLVNHRSK